MPKRLRVKGDLFHGVVPDGAIYVGRAAPGLKASPYANPFKVGESIKRDSELWPFVETHAALKGIGRDAFRMLSSIKLLLAEDVTDCYSMWLYEQPHLFLNVVADLGGRDLACWCPLPRGGKPDPCHAAWLIDLARELAEPGEDPTP